MRQCFFWMKYSALFGPIPPSLEYIFFPQIFLKFPSRKCYSILINTSFKYVFRYEFTTIFLNCIRVFTLF